MFGFPLKGTPTKVVNQRYTSPLIREPRVGLLFLLPLALLLPLSLLPLPRRFRQAECCRPPPWCVVCSHRWKTREKNERKSAQSGRGRGKPHGSSLFLSFSLCFLLLFSYSYPHDIANASRLYVCHLFKARSCGPRKEILTSKASFLLMFFLSSSSLVNTLHRFTALRTLLSHRVELQSGDTTVVTRAPLLF